MYIAASKWTFKRDVSDEEARAVVSQLQPTIQSQPGFRHYYGVKIDEKTALAMHMWDTPEHAEKALQAIGPAAQRILGGLLAGVERMNGEVLQEF